MSPSTFAELGVSRPVAAVLAQRGIHEPFAIQRLVIGDVLAGRDVLAKSPTGSGKTLAFALPMIERIEPGRGPAALVLAPTRELAAQIVEHSQPLARVRGLEVAAVYGGVGFDKQIRAGKRADILVATPGRLEDLMGRRAVKFDNLQFLVLDEADRMLDMGFRPAVDRIVGACPRQRQTLFFSATLDGEAGRIASEYTRDPVRREHVPAGRDGAGAPQVEHRFVPVVHEDKLDALVAELRAERGLTLVFVRTKRGADRLVKRLARAGVDAAAMHGDKSQAQREKALARFEAGKVDTLVATDVAARGIHVGGISHVINFDPPEDRDGYVHRIGRTARAGRSGVGITFVVADQARDVGKIAASLDLHEQYETAGFARPAEHSARPHASGGPKRRRYGSSRGRARW
jgi:ATP-dependent RNA helicase RhlE